MLVLASSASQFAAATLIARLLRPIRQVIAVGDEYLRIVVVELRRLGHHLRQLEHVPGDGQHDAVAHHARSSAIVLVAVPVVAAVAVPGFELRWIWYISVATVVRPARR